MTVLFNELSQQKSNDIEEIKQESLNINFLLIYVKNFNLWLF